MRAFLLLFSFMFAWLAHAECYYSNVELKLELSTTTGESLICYQTVSSCDFDAEDAKLQEYLIELLSTLDTTDSIAIYRHRLKYSYCTYNDCPEAEKTSVYELFEELHLNKQEVTSVQLVDYLSVPSYSYIANQLELSDTVWMMNDPLERIYYTGYLCDHTVFVYEKNEALAVLLDQMDSLQSEINEMGAERSDDEDAKMNVWIDRLKMNNNKLIIISSCTD